MTIRLWDLSVQPTAETDAQWHVDGVVSALAMSPDATACLVASNTLAVWRKSSASVWSPHSVLYTDKSGCLYDVSWCPDGTRWVSCFFASDGAHELAVFDAESTTVVVQLGAPNHAALCCRYGCSRIGNCPRQYVWRIVRIPRIRCFSFSV